jgi:hypothetical protein
LALDARAGNVNATQARSDIIADLAALEQAWAARAEAGDKGSKAVVRQIRRQRARLTQPA